MQFKRSTLLSALFALVAPLAGAAEGGLFEFSHCLGGIPQTVKHGDGNAANIVMMNGNIRSAAPGGLLDNTGSQCAVLNGALNGSMFAHGVCEFTDLDGDRLLIEFQRKNEAGTFHSVAGTGKYQSMRLEGTYTHSKFPQRPGYFQGCIESKGRWQRP